MEVLATAVLDCAQRRLPFRHFKSVLLILEYWGEGLLSPQMTEYMLTKIVCKEDSIVREQLEMFFALAESNARSTLATVSSRSQPNDKALFNGFE